MNTQAMEHFVEKVEKLEKRVEGFFMSSFSLFFLSFFKIFKTTELSKLIKDLKLFFSASSTVSTGMPASASSGSETPTLSQQTQHQETSATKLDDFDTQQRIKDLFIKNSALMTSAEIMAIVYDGRLPTRVEKSHVNRNLSLLHQHNILTRHPPEEFKDNKARFCLKEERNNTQDF